MVNVRSNTAVKQPKGKRKQPDGKPFNKGYDPRRNVKGRPKAFDQWRELAQDIMQQVATNKDGIALQWNGQEITFAEFILLTWAMDKKQQEKIVEAAFGKVPDVHELTGAGGKDLNIIIRKASDATDTGNNSQ